MDTKGRTWTRIAFPGFSWLFVIGLLVQVLLVGLGLFAALPMWALHGDVGHSIGGVVLLLVILAHVGNYPRSIKSQTWWLFGIYIFPAEVLAAVRSTLPLGAALHPALALVLFWLAVTLAQQAWALVRVAHEVSISPRRAVERAPD